MIDDTTIILVDDEGNEAEFEILLTFETDVEPKKSYVFYHQKEEDAEDGVAEVYVSRYDENQLYDIETDEELEMVEEVYNAFIDENGLGTDE